MNSRMIQFFELFWETNDEKISFWRIERKKVRLHPIIDVRYSLLKMSNIVWEVSSREWYEKLIVISVEFMTWRWIRYDFTERSKIKIKIKFHLFIERITKWTQWRDYLFSSVMYSTRSTTTGTLLLICRPRRVASWVGYSGQREEWTESSPTSMGTTQWFSLLKADAVWCVK